MENGYFLPSVLLITANVERIHIKRGEAVDDAAR